MGAVSSGSPLRVVLLTGVLTGTSKWIDISAYPRATFWFKTNGNPGAGTCVIEEADYDPATQMIPSKTFSAIVTVDIDVSVGTDGQYSYHLPSDRSYHFVRARIGTDVTVATLDVVLTAN